MGFYQLLKKRYPDYTVVLQDERYSTKQAQTLLKQELLLKGSQIKKNIDKFSATIILENYLASLKGK
jgi:RNase H-fold protein (predicted Holliday junction resolvase)